ncbi:hypothetical protein CASFOL_015878 [Castilleja foliolosa]|uniref:BZIP domain-containing protein n=1 Tax=Castilleja foliolosa TaxID=1961234 RepID=A0ABD3DEZ9_9LAMI
MASSSGNSSGSPPVQNSGSDEDLLNLRKRKRMQSNRESARRSRQRKQKQMDDLTVQVAQLKKDNGQISSGIDMTTQQYVSVEADNSVLRAQMMELTQRLDSLNEILSYINSGGRGGSTTATATGGCVFEAEDFQGFGDEIFNSNNNNLWNSVGFNHLQPIMASSEMYDCY